MAAGMKVHLKKHLLKIDKFILSKFLFRQDSDDVRVGEMIVIKQLIAFWPIKAICGPWQIGIITLTTRSANHSDMEALRLLKWLIACILPFLGLHIYVML